MRRTELSLVGGMVLAMVVATFPGTALAQRDAGAKMRGEIGTGFWNNQSAQRRMGHARDYASGLFDYSWRSRRFNPRYATFETVELERNVQAAQKNLAVVGEEHAENKQVLTALESINKHLITALEHHAAYCRACAQEDGDRANMMACCSEMLVMLDKAITEHQALIRRITTMGAGEVKAAQDKK